MPRLLVFSVMMVPGYQHQLGVTGKETVWERIGRMNHKDVVSERRAAVYDYICLRNLRVKRFKNHISIDNLRSLKRWNSE